MPTEGWELVVPEKPDVGRGLTRLGERFLIECFGGVVWLTEVDHFNVPFYQAYANQVHTKALCADLRIGIGETLGLGQRHLSSKHVVEELAQNGVPQVNYE